MASKSRIPLTPKAEITDTPPRRTCADAQSEGCFRPDSPTLVRRHRAAARPPARVGLGSAGAPPPRPPAPTKAPLMPLRVRALPCCPRNGALVGPGLKQPGPDAFQMNTSPPPAFCRELPLFR
eukprot:2093496-Rhodomonas_salina.2